MAVTVLLELQLKPDQVDAAKAMFKEILPDTRAYEGCTGVDVVGNQDDATNLVLVETWAERAHHEAYMTWRQETGLIDRLGPLLAGPPSIRYYDPVDA